jgi:transglutaminase-like putative cysteine protease
VAALPLLLLPLGGCSDLLDQINPPQYQVQASQPTPGAWTTDNHFEVFALGGEAVHIAAESSDGARRQADGDGHAEVVLPDGTWSISYTINGHAWRSYDDVRIDTTPPSIVGLETLASTETGDYVLGSGARVEGQSVLRVVDEQTGAVVRTELPVSLHGLSQGLHLYQVSAGDEAGNFANLTVQLWVGRAADLPVGQYTFGIVARYAGQVRVWDLTHPEDYLTVAAAAQATGGSALGSGYDITPGDAAVTNAVDGVVAPGMTTMERALALFRYMMRNLHYDTSRLDSDKMLSPREVLLDAEDPHDTDTDGDGIVDAGSGNGVKGGVCRDLAAAYVSLLRAAKVPARVVSGYVAGTVNGFHAWVEFYAGTPAADAGQPPWVPVDVSVVDGTERDVLLLQAFGILHPDYLTLRAVPDASEVAGWATALGVRYDYHEGAEPVITFEKRVMPEFESKGVLCFDPETRARATRDNRDGSACASFGFFVEDFTLATTRTIDYGIDVRQAPSGTRVQAEAAYPFEDSVAPNQVDFRFYGPAFTLDETAGKAKADFRT